MKEANYRIEVFYKIKDARGEVICRKLQELGFRPGSVVITDNYLVNADINQNDAAHIAGLFIQQVTQDYCINEAYMPERFDYAVEIGFLPGVTDNVAHTARESIEDFLKTELNPEDSVFSSRTYFIQGDVSDDDVKRMAFELHNPVIERMTILSAKEYKAQKGMKRILPLVNLPEQLEVDEINLNIDNEELLELGKKGIADKDGTRRGPLALDMDSLEVIREYFNNTEKRWPTDVELESIAQTWSEHCKHTIFAASIDEIEEGIFKAYIREATERIRRDKGTDDFCLSVFSDNSGGIIFDDEYIVSDKVETHNSPSALDPFGGAITGIVGVNRDAIGFGMAAKPVANRYGFCFASPFDEDPLYRDKQGTSRLLSPRRIMEGVIHGVNVGGNCSGIPTPQGFVYFDERYKGKPLVFVGTVGLMPRLVVGNSSVEKAARPGDNIIMVGGRVGQDGIHGATFSSEALSSGSPATAVQIGDPITQKKLSDAIVKEARDLGLFNSITDNGAGGLSCSVAEMARESGGFKVNLDRVPLKYPGLAPWQVWVSESQERMTLSVPDDKLDEFLELMKRRGVEATVIGHFTDDDRGVVISKGRKIFDLDMNFLHDGLPDKELKTTYTKEIHPYPDFPEQEDINETFHDMLKRLNTASFGFISYQYDHEVQANSAIKPLQGKGQVNGNASVIRPVLDSPRGVVLSQGLYPSYGDIDMYWMAACSIDTAIRNAISAGGTLDSLAILDNFCWCDSNNPERLGQLKAAARACYDFAVAFGTPFISGKDSMFNDFKGYNKDLEQVMISVPPTLLISSIGVVPDIMQCQSIDFKISNYPLYLVGSTGNELGGSEYLAFMGEKISGRKFIGDVVPKVFAEKSVAIYRAYTKALEGGMIASSISLERGGLGLALGKSAMAGMMGCTVFLSKISDAQSLRNDTILYSESQGRLLASVSPSKVEEFEKLFEGLPISRLGTVSDSSEVKVYGKDDKLIINTDIHDLLESYKDVFRGF